MSFGCFKIGCLSVDKLYALSASLPAIPTFCADCPGATLWEAGSGGGSGRCLLVAWHCPSYPALSKPMEKLGAIQHHELFLLV